MARPPTSGSLFCHADGAPVTSSQFSSVLAKCIARTQFSSGHFRSHSFRIGRATDLAASGCSTELIKTMGRWSSESYLGYIRL